MVVVTFDRYFMCLGFNVGIAGKIFFSECVIRSDQMRKSISMKFGIQGFGRKISAKFYNGKKSLDLFINGVRLKDSKNKSSKTAECFTRKLHQTNYLHCCKQTDYFSI